MPRAFSPKNYPRAKLRKKNVFTPFWQEFVTAQKSHRKENIMSSRKKTAS